MEYFESHLNQAILRCDGYFTKEMSERNGFFEIYPFTTENISGYINRFKLKNRSLLTVGSSGDQVINAALEGCNSISVYDICPFTKYYFYLKKAALLTLNYNEFLDFLCYRGYKDKPISQKSIICHFKDNDEVLNFRLFGKIIPILRLLDYESYLFWDELIQNYDSRIVHERLFSNDEDKITVLKKMNLYLKNKAMYEKTKNLIKNLKPHFIIGNIYDLNLNDSYDNIFLSNISCYNSSVNNYKYFLDQMVSHLNKDGEMMISYLYGTTIDTKYQDNWHPIYDLNITLELLNEYVTDFYSFIGTHGILWEDNNDKDSIIIYKKNKH